MRRDTQSLVDRSFDVIVIGGGVFGVCVARDAALRGLSVALLEKGDFAAATSAHSFKIVHGGIRYLQHGDLARVRESIRERRAFLRIAPHLVKPLPILVPTYGHGIMGKEILAAGTALYDLVAWDRNRGIEDPARRIPRGRSLSRDECLERFPDLERRGLTGGVLFHDAQMYNPQRLALSVLRSATERGAVAANYVEATDLIREGDRIVGVEAWDRIHEERFQVRGRVVVNAAGAWAEGLLARALRLKLEPPSTFSRDACFIAARRWASDDTALAVTGATRDPDAILSRPARHLFLVPWRDRTLVGVWHRVHRGRPDSFDVSEGELRAFIDEINSAYPALALSRDEVAMVSAGLVLFGQNAPGARDLSYGKRSRVIDHRRAHALKGLVSVIGVRYTMARGVAERALRLAFGQLGYEAPACRTADTPVFGGDFERVDELTDWVRGALPDGCGDDVAVALARNYGAEYARVLRYCHAHAWAGEPLGDTHVLKAEVLHAVREEMALRLADVVLRRTDLGTAGFPGDEALESCAGIMAEELGWPADEASRQLAEVRGVYRRFRSERSGIDRELVSGSMSGASSPSART